MAEADPAATAAPEPAAPHLEAGTEPPAAAAAPEPAAAPEIPAREPSLLSSHEPAAAEPAAAAEGEPKPAEEPKPKGEAEPAKKDEPAAEAPKPDEPKPDGEPAPTEPAEPAAPEPITYEFKFPEGIEIDDKKLEGFRGIASEIRIPPEKAQALLDLYNTSVKEFHDNALAEQHRVFNETRKAWRNEVMADEEIGGSGFNTAMATIAKVRDRFVPEGERKAFNEFCDLTGAGDNPLFMRMIHRIGKALAEPAPPPPNPKPSPNPIARDRRATLYDNPRSPGNG